ncbi:transcriptional regulator [Streptomyces longispororuber]|uniref:Transcriptional regulator n=1 Tax=Streptomyces longispororuber TaxID=68230 RepID=A0A918ZGP7_9ACTN|nr:GAF and ANTAR domain-containing protein [Streptomyces longispororuber]GHE52376.1 transcriptional regulator [Streptomyces longispororuber]
MNRAEQWPAAMVEVVDTLVDDVDLIDFLRHLCDRCTELLDVPAVGVMLSAPTGKLQLIAASDEHTGLLELFALPTDEGPCVECYRTGTARLNIDLRVPSQVSAFPRFAERARQGDFVTGHALPMRVRRRVVGALNLFDTREQELSETDARVAQALADVATIAVLQHRTLVHTDVERAQTKAALSSRVVIEQAKGILAERRQATPDEAFGAPRRHARAHQFRLTAPSRQVIDGSDVVRVIQRP